MKIYIVCDLEGVAGVSLVSIIPALFMEES